MKKILNYLYYIKDILSDLSSPNVKIEKFSLDSSEERIHIFYRLGRQKLIHRNSINDFDADYYNKLSQYDKQRLKKFLTLQDILNILKDEKESVKKKIIKHLLDEINHDKFL